MPKSIYVQNMEYAMWYFNAIHHTSLKTIEETARYIEELNKGDA